MTERELPPDQSGLIERLTGYDEIELIGPEQLKIDSDIGLEKIWFGLLAISFLVTFMGLFDACDQDKSAAWSFMAFGLGGMVIFGLLYKFTDNYYVIDLPERKLLYKHSFLGFRGSKVLGTLSDLYAVVVQGKKASSRSGAYWVYSVLLVTRKGKQIPITEDSQHQLDANNDMAAELGSLLGCDVYPCPEEAVTRIYFDASKMEVAVEQVDKLPLGERVLQVFKWVGASVLSAAVLIAILLLSQLIR